MPATIPAPMDLRTCQIVSRGRFAAAEPMLSPGTALPLMHARKQKHLVGQLALVDCSRNPPQVIEPLGAPDNIHAVMRGLLAEWGCLGPRGSDGRLGGVPAAVGAQLDALPEGIPHAADRTDLRDLPTLTIDPADARDHDDALSVEDIGNGTTRLWVHIADVAAYIPTGSPLDAWAEEQSFSAYVPGQVAPMLPLELSADRCSLRAGEDRAAVTVEFELEGAAVSKVRFLRSIIRVDGRCTYDEVDELLAASGAAAGPDVPLLRVLDSLTSELRTARAARGALDVGGYEVQFKLDDHRPVSAHVEAESPSHRLVEECMLLANNAVGGRLASAQEPGIWRCHDHPDPTAVEAIFEELARLDVPVPDLAENASAAECALAVAQLANRLRQMGTHEARGRTAFRMRLLRAVQRAGYRATPGRHSGLATTNYAHFTSPIRRYPDLVVHRSLARHLGWSDEEPAAMDLGQIAAHASDMEADLTALERLAEKITRAHLLHRLLREDAIGEAHTGEVVGLISSGIFVRFADVYEGMLPARLISDDERNDLDEHGLAMVGAASGRAIRLGDWIDVTVASVDTGTGRISLRPG